MMNVHAPKFYFIPTTVPNILLCPVLKCNKYLEMVQDKRINMAINLEQHDFKVQFGQLLPQLFKSFSSFEKKKRAK